MNAYSERIFVLSLLSCVFSRTFLSGGIGAPIFSAFSRILPRVYLKSRNYRLFLQAQPDYALKILGIRKGFLRLFALHPACVCEISVIFFVFRYTLNTSAFMPHPLPNFMRIPNPVRVLDTRKFSEQNFLGTGILYFAVRCGILKCQILIFCALPGVSWDKLHPSGAISWKN